VAAAAVEGIVSDADTADKESAACDETNEWACEERVMGDLPIKAPDEEVLAVGTEKNDIPDDVDDAEDDEVDDKEAEVDDK
jgi:hypothetical protein